MSSLLVGEPATQSKLGQPWFVRAAVTADHVVILMMRVLLGFSMLAELILVIANIIDREFFHHSLSWELPGAELALLAIGFLGGAIAFSRDDHIAVDFLTRKFSARTTVRVQAVNHWLAVALATVTCLWTAQSYPAATLQTIPGVNLSQGIFALVLAIATGLIAFDSLVKLLTTSLRDNLLGLGFAAALAVLIYLASDWSWAAASPGRVLLLGAILAVLVILLGSPLPLALLLLLVVYTISGNNVTAFVPLGLESALGDFVLLAIPFFVFAGFLMTDGGLAKSIVDLLAPVLRRLPGGSLQLAVGTMFVFSGMTGSKMADVTAVGSAMTDGLVEEGYSAAEVACVLSACAAAGETIPPSIALLILGTVTSLSVGTLFVAGIFPAALVLAFIAVLIAVRHKAGLTRRGGVAGTPPALPPLLVRLWRGLLALGLPVVLLGGIETGWFTATEASAVAVLYAALIACITKPRLSVRRLWPIMERGAAMAGMLLLLVSMAHTVALAAALAGIPQEVGSWLTSLSDSKIIFLLITILVIPIAAALLEGLPAILIFAPLLVPRAEMLGINLTQYGIVFVLALGVGAFSPLLGIGFYTTCKVTRADVSEATRRYAAYFAALMVGIIVVAFIPSVTTVLPAWLHD